MPDSSAKFAMRCDLLEEALVRTVVGMEYLLHVLVRANLQA